MIIGTAGHIDHGKTALVRALTGVDTDRLREEKARGISIDLGFAYLPAPNGSTIGFVDVPGHEKFIRNMLAGVAGIDFVLLAVAADDGVMPQTVEHLAIVDLLGVNCGLVALTKVDLVAPERIAEVRAEVANLLSSTTIPAAEIVPVSSVTGVGIDQLKQKLLDAAGSFRRVGGAGRFRLAIDRCFTLVGIGTVVTGTVLSGRVAVGDRVIVSPAGIEAHVRRIHAHNRPADMGHAGDRCALNLVGRGIRKEAITRGDVTLDPTLHAPAERIDASLRVLSTEPKALKAWTPVRLHHAATHVGAHVVPLNEETLAPGLRGMAQLVLDRPIAAAAGDPFVLRDATEGRTMGGGRFLDLRAPARKRRRPERLDQLEALANTDPDVALSKLLACQPGCCDVSSFARDRALNVLDIEGTLARIGAVVVADAGHVLAFAPEAWAQLRADLVSALEAFHARNPDLPGLAIERLRPMLNPKLSAEAFAAVLQRFAREQEVSLTGAWVRLAGYEVAMTQADEELWQRIAALLDDDAKFAPPRVRDIARMLAIPESDARRVMKLAGHKVLLFEVAHDHFYLRSAVSEIADRVWQLAGGDEAGAFSLAQFRDSLNTGRKVAMQVLEFFDRHGATARRGELRLANRRRLDRFRTREC